MTIMARQTQKNRIYINTPGGSYQGVCCDVVDLGIVTPKNPQHKPAHKVVFKFLLDELITKKMVLDAKKTAGDNTPLSENEAKLVGQPLIVGKRVTLSTHEKATMRKDLLSWRGKDLNDTEVNEGFDVETMIGQNANLSIVLNQFEGKTYSNIASLSPMRKGKDKPMRIPKGFVRAKDREGYKAPSATGAAGSEEEEAPFE